MIRDGSMPPWYGAPEHEEFINHRGLSAEEKSTVLAWLKSDRPLGDANKLPPPLPAAPEWRIEGPDRIVFAPEHEIPESGDVAYKYALLPYVFMHDTWVNGVEIKPDNPRVLHHCNMAFAKIGEKFSVQNFITGAVPGGESITLPEGVAVKHTGRLGSGPSDSLTFRRASRRSAASASASAIRTAPCTNSSNLHTWPPLATRSRRARRPPRRARAGRCRATPSASAMFSHMHLRGSDMTFLAHTPDGKTQTLLTVPNYNFGWQHAYRWEFGSKRWPKGTRLECIAHYDNSAFNPTTPIRKRPCSTATKPRRKCSTASSSTSMPMRSWN